jgi:hypothetical protein
VTTEVRPRHPGGLTSGVRVRKAAPVTTAALRAMTDTLDRNSLVGIRDTALLVLGFTLGARRSELAALDIADLSFAAEGVQVEVRTSKTDRDSRGRTAAMPYGAHSVTCPVRTAQAWLAPLPTTGGAQVRFSCVSTDTAGSVAALPAGAARTDGSPGRPSRWSWSARPPPAGWTRRRRGRGTRYGGAASPPRPTAPAPTRSTSPAPAAGRTAPPPCSATSMMSTAGRAWGLPCQCT